MPLSLYRRRIVQLPAFILISILASKVSHADTYRIADLGTDAGVFMYGITDSGNVVLDNSLYCATTCFTTYVNGTYAGRTVAAPDLAFDDGDPCSPSSSSALVVEHAICNGVHEAATGYKGPFSPVTGIYAGADLSTLVAFGGEGSLMLNAVGDIVWDDHFSEEIYEAIDLTSPVPEPANWILLGSGLLALAAGRHRQMVKASSARQQASRL